jgi:hypothetical protein
MWLEKDEPNVRVDIKKITPAQIMTGIHRMKA